MQIDIQAVSWHEAEQDLRTLRQQVFIDEQNVPEDLEWDGLDAEAWHWLAFTPEKIPVACARLLSTGQVGRIVVLPEWRRKGIGSDLVRTAVAYAKTLQLPPVFLHAQSYIVPMYEQLGFTPTGDIYEEAGIPHQTMVQTRV